LDQRRFGKSILSPGHIKEKFDELAFLHFERFSHDAVPPSRGVMVGYTAPRTTVAKLVAGFYPFTKKAVRVPN
jgi:hypothetical protein